MDFLISAGINAVLQILKDKRERAKWVRALAKVYVAIENVSLSDDALMAEIIAKREGKR